MLNIAFIGNGKGVNRYHIPFVQKVDGIHIKTIYSRSAKCKFDKLEGVNYTHDLNDIYNDAEIGLVVISTPAQTHYSLAKDALMHGMNVLVDKPFVETPEQAKELFSLAKEKGLFLQCYQNRRYDSDFLTVQKVIESGVLGDIQEVEMSFDYYRPEWPEAVYSYDRMDTYVYGHACHTVDQVLSYFGDTENIQFDVRQLLGEGRMCDYFDIDFIYNNALKISVKSSFFRIKSRPSFVVYGKKGMFVKETKDRQEEHLKLFYLPTNPDFGIDLPEHYGTLTYMDENNVYHEEKVISEVGDYSRVYQGIFETLVNGKEKIVKDEQTIRQIEILKMVTDHLR